MVIPRTWKVVSGGAAVAVALGAGAAIAQPGKNPPTLEEVAESRLEAVPPSTIAPTDDGGVLVELTAESPLSELSIESEESPESPESEPSEESPESEP
ncbi:MAG: hypothetical protein AB1Z55_12080, partial [Acidimicrobiia bacterium]